MPVANDWFKILHIGIDSEYIHEQIKILGHSSGQGQKLKSREVLQIYH